ncbi:hypothetical protein, partial [Zoogloea sp. LCSB751]|uniref:hypothetical protein n=1 Tax=Zoogloea sp. LCSB751 TaxID=1965277 RepID=UPI001C1F7014
MQAYLSLIRDIFVICTTSVTVSGICTKTLNNLFLDIVKSKYRNIPGKQALFNTVFKCIVYSGWVISVIVTFTRLGAIVL